MSDRAGDEGSTETAVDGGEDRIGALPDHLLSYLMSFLLSREAVRTCVLAKRWRTLWKSVPALRINEHICPGSSSTFVDDLIRLRGPVPLNVCDFSSVDEHDPNCDLDQGDSYGSSDSDGPSDVERLSRFHCIKLWLQYALSCQVQVLRVCDFDLKMTLVSWHLKKLVLDTVWCEGCSLDFSSCQVLEVLELNNCGIYGAHISSKSLQHLKIDVSGFLSLSPIHIFAPNLICFRLAFCGCTPFLDSMPSLVTASVMLTQSSYPDHCSCGNLSCKGCDVQTRNDAALKSLSRATNLELTATDNVFVFRNYLKCKPLFDKLKTLLLNEWCMVDNFTALVYFLHHSPILETLTLQLGFESREEQRVTKRDESYDSSVRSNISRHLKVVKIICDMKEDARVHRILKVLCTHGVSSEQIDIQ